MKSAFALVAFVFLLAVPLAPACPVPGPVTPAGPASVAALAGGQDYFYCALGNALMWGGLLTLQPEVTLGGAIIMGLGCGTGN